MSFKVKSLELNNFRSYPEALVRFDQKLTILWGSNAAGKTNILEALQLLTEGRSFRKPTSKELLLWGSKSGSAFMSATNENLIRDVKLVIDEKSRFIEVNGKKVSSSRSLWETLPCVVFTPEDLQIVKDSPKRRRYEVDSLGAQLSSTYSSLVNEYSKIVIQRNRMLKEGQYGSLAFEAWSDRLIDVGFALVEKRKGLLRQLKKPMVNFYNEVIGPMTKDQELSIEYRSSWGDGHDKCEIKDLLNSKKIEEINRRSTLLGPHRDDVIFEIEGKDARIFSSQGQQRTIALAWKMSELFLVEKIIGVRPLLLLDDVMSELDQERRSCLAVMVNRAAQTVITTTNLEYFDEEILKGSKMIKIPQDVV